MNRTAASLTVLAAVTTTALVGQSAPDLAQRLDRVLDVAPFERATWGVLVVDERGETIYARNPDRYAMPASTAKLAVATAAALLYAPDFRMRTSVYVHGTVTDSVVEGDLMLYGRGDPSIGRTCYDVDTVAVGNCDSLFVPFREMAATLHRHGIRRVTGSVIGDGSFFEATVIHPAWEAYDLNWYYAAPVTGLGFNDNTIDFRYRPGSSVDAPAVITWAPEFGAFRFDNRTRTAPRGTERTIDFFREPGTWNIWAEGDVPIGRRSRMEYFAVPDPNLYAAMAFTWSLEQEGIVVGGSARSTVDSLAYAESRLGLPLAEHYGRPMSDLVFPIVNVSNNWFAEMVIKRLGKDFAGEGSWDAGVDVVAAILIDSVGLDSTSFDLVDASGLAAQNLMTPRALVEIIRYVRAHPAGEPIMDALARPGIRGSLRTRLNGFSNGIVAKTGTIGRVNTLVGFVERPDGTTYTFAIMLNHHAERYSRAVARIDRVIEELLR